MKGYIVVSNEDTKANILLNIDKATEIQKSRPDSRLVTVNLNDEELSTVAFRKHKPKGNAGCYFMCLKIIYTILLIVVGLALLSCFGCIPEIWMQIWTCLSVLIMGAIITRTLSAISHVQDEEL